MLILKKVLITLVVMSIFAMIAAVLYSRHPSIIIAEKPKVETKVSMTITKIIHQSWKDKNVRARFLEFSKTWTNECFKDWKYMFWTEVDNRNLVKSNYSWFLSAYDALPGPIYRADVSRYFYMLHYGGIYTNFDNECLKPFGHLLGNYKLVFSAIMGPSGGENLKEGYVTNSFMYSTGGHQFWLELLRKIKDRVEKNQTGESIYLTGSLMLSKAVRDFRSQSHNLPSTEMKIYESNYFSPFSYVYKSMMSPHCEDFGYMAHDIWQVCRKFMIDKGSYIAQYNKQS